MNRDALIADRSLYTALVAEWLFPLHERLKGHRTARVLREMECTQWWPPEQLEAYRVERLRDFLSRVGTAVPYYRRLFKELGFDPAAITRVAELRQLPPTEKQAIRDHADELKAEGAAGLVEYRTSGSTGEPLTLYVSKERISHDIAAKWRGTRWWGVDIGDPEIVVWGSPVELNIQDRLRHLRDRVLRSHLLPIIDISNEKLDRYLDQIRRVRPKMVFGYPSALSRMAWRAKERGMEMGGLGIRVIFVTSEILQPQWKNIIVEVFKCPIANEYGARDGGFIARECPSGGLHITAEDIIVEIVDADGRALPAGRPGEVLVTHLISADFPFLRYRTGDIATLEDRPCPCGRGLPLLRDISGRTNDCLVAADGSFIHDSALNYVIKALEDVRSYKIIQESLDRVRVLIVAGPRFRDEFIPSIHSAYKRLLGETVAIVIERVDDIPPEPSGKFRHVVNRMR